MKHLVSYDWPLISKNDSFFKWDLFYIMLSHFVSVCVCVCVCVCECTHTSYIWLLVNPLDGSPPGFSVHGILKARRLEWIDISYSRDVPHTGIEPASPVLVGSSLALCYLGSPVNLSVQFSCVRLFATLWTAARQASLPITNSRSLPKLMSIESVMPSNHLILSRPLLLPSIFPSIRVFSNESALHIRWPK